MEIFLKRERFSLEFIGFLQAVGLVAYCSLVGLLFWGAEKWFGRMTSFLGPVLFLTLFVVSVLSCALIGLAYPVVLFWEKKQTGAALKLVAYTATWLIIFIILLILILAFF